MKKRSQLSPQEDLKTTPPQKKRSNFEDIKTPPHLSSSPLSISSLTPTSPQNEIQNYCEPLDSPSKPKLYHKHPLSTESPSSSPPPSPRKSDIKTIDKESVKFSYTEVRGDLFSDEKSSLGHCVSEDLRMGKGIAKTFKSKFGSVPELKKQNQKTGGLCILKRDERYIYYLVTKKIYKDKPTYEDLEQSIELMKDHCIKENVTHLSLPKIGCGLDGLFWPNVRGMLKKSFEDTNICLTIYYL